MATGDKTDIAGRLMSRMPPWFSGGSAAVGAIFAGAAAAFAQIYAMLAFVVAQMRLATTSGGFLDMFATDYFGGYVVRRISQTDAALLARIKALFFLQRNTRPGMIAALTVLTGNAPTILELMSPGDTGGYRTGALFYRSAGTYGSTLAPGQMFLTAYRPYGVSGAYIPGYHTAPGGYRSLGTYYGNVGGNGGVADQDILDTINAVRPAGVTVWSRILNAASPSTSSPTSLDFSQSTNSGLKTLI